MMDPGSPRRPARRWFWPTVIGGLAAVVVVVVVVGAVVVVGSSMFSEPAKNPDPAAVVAFAGFGPTTGLEVTGVEYASWLDANGSFVLRGSPADVDKALEAAHFTTPMKPDMHAQSPAMNFDLASIGDVRSAGDTWINPGGHRIYRNVVRGTSVENPGVEIVHVRAHTT